ncbi:glycine/sarcosine/betaine reductase selenoprotein B family protein [Lysobacter korlensis]|uniref:Glycine/sarcosine/betaine reductase selenoprotein B family protein n=1 Tax=Lysobacter korlensis TaxID=553636 RepID=A0ABV6RS44_9GAMM
MTETSSGPSGGNAAPQGGRTAAEMRPGLWETVNDRYPGSMVDKQDFVPLAPLPKPLSECRVAFISTSGTQPKGSMPFDTVHPVGDYSFRRVPSSTRAEDLEIHQLKYPTVGANRDINVIFPIDRLRELAEEGIVGGLTENFYTFIGYNMDPERLERSLAEDIAAAVVAEGADIALAAPA